MDPIGPGNHERAWNDPPKFAFNSAGVGGTGNPSGRRRLLNKRVPVPTGPPTGNPSIPPPLKLGDGPPLGLGVAGPPMTKPPTDAQLSDKTVFSPKSEDLLSKDKKSSQDILIEVETAFKSSLEKVSEHLKNNAREEIDKRFEVMKTMWTDAKLNDIIHGRMLKLTEALDVENFDEAWAIHQGLIVDFTSLCSPWMIGIKTLIIESRNHRKIPASDGETDKPESNEIQTEVPMVLSPLDISKVRIDDNEPDEKLDNVET